jgi:hypothetical protein
VIKMNRVIFLALILTLALSPARAGQGIPVQPIYLYRSAGTMQFLSATQLASAIGLPGIPTTAPSSIIAEICVETAGIRYTDDGATTPTASVGIPVVGTSSAPSCFQYAGPLSAFKAILISGSPTMDISYYYAN